MMTEKAPAQSLEKILTKGWTVKERLLTKDDPFHLHATLGTLCLLSFAWRFAQYGATDMGFLTYPKLTAPTIAIHFILSISSLIFHVPKARIKKTGHKMMWAEYRLHAIVFGGRSLACMAWNYYEEVTHHQPNYLVNLLIVVGTLLAADISSHQAGGKTRKQSIRGLTDVPSWLKFYYSLLQFFATSYCLFGLRRYTGHMIMVFVIQVTAFLFTLKRKNLAPHDFTLRFIYTSFLYFGSRLGRRELGQHSSSFIAPYIVTAIACCACVLRIASPEWSPTKNKYVIWIGLGAALHYIRIVRPEIYATLENHPQTVRATAKAIFFLTVAFGLVKDQIFCTIHWNRAKANQPPTSATKQAIPASPTDPDQEKIERKRCKGNSRESGVDRRNLPRHVAIIMDGNRRYGRKHYSSSSKQEAHDERTAEEAAYEGHKDGVRTLFNVVKWCHEEEIEVLTVYGFSTENWHRSPSEVLALMTLFEKSAKKYHEAFIQNNIRVHLVSTGASLLPVHVRAALEGLQAATAHCTGGLEVNLCISYSGREEIVGACRKIADQVAAGDMSVDSINESTVQQALLRPDCPDPDLLIRTSGDFRISNFLLWHLAYTELFFLKDIHWPEFQKHHLLKVIREYAECRQRRFGK